jgi:hypothetical protein
MERPLPNEPKGWRQLQAMAKKNVTRKNWPLYSNE